MTGFHSETARREARGSLLTSGGISGLLQSLLIEFIVLCAQDNKGFIRRDEMRTVLHKVKRKKDMSSVGRQRDRLARLDQPKERLSWAKLAPTGTAATVDSETARQLDSWTARQRDSFAASAHDVSFPIRTSTCVHQ